MEHTKDQIKPFRRRFNRAGSRALLSGGAVITWLATGEETGGHFSLFEAKGVPGMEPPPHTHAHEDETYYLLEGELSFTVGGDQFRAGPGEFVFLPRGVRHEFKVLSDRFRCLVGIHPAGLEDYFEPLTTPHASDDIPPVNTAPPPPEVVEMMQALDKKFGIVYYV